MAPGAWMVGFAAVDTHSWIALGTLALAVTLFISEAIPLAMTALAIPIILSATGTLSSPEDALAGFGNQAVIALAAIFVLGAGLKESGVATLMAKGLQRLGGRSELRLVVVIMVAVAVLSAFMSNAATVAVFLPAVATLSRRSGVPASRLMMPLSFAAIVGGTMTIIGTTPNLILAEDLRLRIGTGVAMEDFAMVGLPVSAVCILYMATIGRRFLPVQTSEDRLRQAHVPEEAAKNYGFTANLYRMRVPPKSSVVGRTLLESAIGRKYSLEVVLVMRPGGLRDRYIHPRPDLEIQANDQLYMQGEMEDAWHFAEDAEVQFGIAGPRSLERILGRGVMLTEVLLPPRSDAIGKTLRELKFRTEYGLNVLSSWRRGEAVAGNVADSPLELGDGLLVSGPAEAVRRLMKDPRFIVLTDNARGEDVRRAPIAISLLLLALVPPLVGWMPLALSAMASALLMLATGCVSKDSLRHVVDFRILFLIVGTIPLGIALEQTGVAHAAAHYLVQLGPLLGTAGILASLFIVAALLSTTSNNGAAAVILAPVAWEVAQASGMDVTRTFLAVAFGTSCAFLLPFAHQCNLMVMGAGGYHTRDFARAGLGMSLVMAVATITMLLIL